MEGLNRLSENEDLKKLENIEYILCQVRDDENQDMGYNMRYNMGYKYLIKNELPCYHAYCEDLDINITIHDKQENKDKETYKLNTNFIFDKTCLTEDKKKRQGVYHINVYNLDKILPEVKELKDTTFDLLVWSENTTETNSFIYIYSDNYLYKRGDIDKHWDENTTFLRAKINFNDLIYFNGKYFRPNKNLTWKTYERKTIESIQNWLKEKMDLQECAKVIDFINNLQDNNDYARILKIKMKDASDLEDFFNRFKELSEDYKKEHLTEIEQQVKEENKDLLSELTERESNLKKDIDKLEQEKQELENEKEEIEKIVESLKKNSIEPYYNRIKEIKKVLLSVNDEEELSDFVIKKVKEQELDKKQLGGHRVTICSNISKSWDRYLCTYEINYYGIIHITPMKNNDFYSFYKAGLNKIIREARKHEDKKYAVIVTDYNIIFPTCWGGPLFDIFKKLTNSLPCENEEFPENIYFFFKPYPDNNAGQDDKVGLPFPYLEETNWVQEINDDNRE